MELCGEIADVFSDACGDTSIGTSGGSSKANSDSNNAKILSLVSDAQVRSEPQQVLRTGQIASAMKTPTKQILSNKLYRRYTT